MEIAEHIGQARDRWPDDRALMNALGTVEARLAQLRAWIAAPMALEPFRGAYAQLVQHVVRSDPRPTAPEATVDAPAYTALADVASDLRAADDVQRCAALDFITAKTTGQTATEVGQAMIEEIARLAQEQAAVYQVGTQFGWALYGIVYDEPAWVDTWAAAANANTHAPALRILNHMQRQTPEVVQAALACWPQANPAAQAGLLHSLSRLARSGVTELPAALRADGVELAAGALGPSRQPGHHAGAGQGPGLLALQRTAYRSNTGFAGPPPAAGPIPGDPWRALPGAGVAGRRG